MDITTLFAASAICLAACVTTTTAQTVKRGEHTPVLQDTYLITGELVGGTSKQIMVCKAHEHPFSNQILVPVIDGKFRIALPAGKSEAYMLIPEENFEGSLKPYIVFPEENVYVVLHPGARNTENTVSGSPLTEEYHRIMATLKQRVEMRRIEIDSLQKRVAAGQLAEEVVIAKDSVLNIDYLRWLDAYVSEHPTLVSYQFIKEIVLMSEYEGYSREIVNTHYPAFAARFPDHPYTELIATYLNGEYQREEGKQYVSFKAEDLAGNLVLADTLLAPKATLLNFWSSWCGPCIGKARTMVPVYEAFKDKGFGIINIARELRDTQSLEALLEREQLPWQVNLVDLESQYGVWHKYGITNLGGAMVLVDGDKQILAVDPTPEEVKALLEQLD
jgi:thiol-disulfide isomerase/thioredoxin